MRLHPLSFLLLLLLLVQGSQAAFWSSSGKGSHAGFYTTRFGKRSPIPPKSFLLDNDMSLKELEAVLSLEMPLTTFKLKWMPRDISESIDKREENGENVDGYNHKFFVYTSK